MELKQARSDGWAYRTGSLRVCSQASQNMQPLPAVHLATLNPNKTPETVRPQQPSQQLQSAAHQSPAHPLLRTPASWQVPHSQHKGRIAGLALHSRLQKDPHMPQSLRSKAKLQTAQCMSPTHQRG